MGRGNASGILYGDTPPRSSSLVLAANDHWAGIELNRETLNSDDGWAQMGTWCGQRTWLARARYPDKWKPSRPVHDLHIHTSKECVDEIHKQRGLLHQLPAVTFEATDERDPQGNPILTVSHEDAGASAEISAIGFAAIEHLTEPDGVWLFSDKVADVGSFPFIYVNKERLEILGMVSDWDNNSAV